MNFPLSGLNFVMWTTKMECSGINFGNFLFKTLHKSENSVL